MSWFRKKDETIEHSYAQERLSPYLDEELPLDERRRVERHLGVCPECSCDLDNLRRTAQWTMALPSVPCPRSFTVPVPAVKRRALGAQRVWGLPVLQGATALVAVLFLLAVVGQVVLPGTLPASAPAPAALERESFAAVEATQVAELAAAPQIEATEASEPDAEAIQLMVAEAPAEATAQPGAMVIEETLAVSEALDAQAAAAASAAPPGMGVGGEATDAQSLEAEVTGAAAKELGGPAEVEALAAVTSVPTATVEPLVTPVPTATTQPPPLRVPTATAEPMLAPAPTATLVPTIEAAPTLLAEAGAEAGPVSLDRSGQPTDGTQKTGTRWLTIAEIALGIAFVVLGTLTVTLMLRRLRRS